MSRAPEEFPPSFTMAELLVHALIIEVEAVQSYLELAEQMEECGNDPVAEVVRENGRARAGACGQDS